MIQRIGPIFKFSLLASTLIFPVVTSAVVTLQSYPQYVANGVLTSGSTEITMFAGRTSRDCTVNNPSFTSSNGTCDSCSKDSQTTVGTNPCNSREIHSSLPFVLTMSSDDANDYPSCAQLIIGRIVGSDSTFYADTISSFQTGQAGQSVTASFSWSAICNAANSGDTSCSKSFNERFEFGFDPACSRGTLSIAPVFNIVFRYVGVSPAMTLGCGTGTGAFEGICTYSTFPGDNKVFIKDPGGVEGSEYYVPDLTSTATNSRDASSMKYGALRMYYKAGSIAGGTASTITTADSFKDLAIAGAKLQEERVTGLTNGTNYVFLGAMVDQAGNVTHFAQPGALQAGVHEATPEEVYGLLDNKGCFIATAAYGTPQANEIQVLRDFRDVSLAHSEWGRGFINFYYKHSPAWAEFIAKHDTLRAMVRVALSPVIWSAEKVLQLGYGISAHKSPVEPEVSKGNP